MVELTAFVVRSADLAAAVLGGAAPVVTGSALALALFRALFRGVWGRRWRNASMRRGDSARASVGSVELQPAAICRRGG